MESNGGAKGVQARLDALGKDRRWLSEKTGYRPSSIRDALAEGSRNGLSPRMAAEIEAVLSAAETEASAEKYAEKFTPAERQAIDRIAKGLGMSGDQWIVGGIRQLLRLFGK